MDFKKTQYCSNNETILHCPVCGFDYVHLVSTETRQDERLSIVLNFECESGHKFSSYLNNHKGYMMSNISVEHEEVDS
jgi:hypothetical protein